MTITPMDRINMIISDPSRATMSIERIVTEEVREFRGSEAFMVMAQAEAYYRNRSDVQTKSNDINGRSNTRIEHAYLKLFIDQKTNYLMAKPWSVNTQNKAYGERLNELFDNSFRNTLRGFCRNLIKYGIGWLQPYIKDGKLAFMNIPATELVPIWADTAHTQLDAFIRVYDTIVYTGNRKQIVTHAELWWSGGVRYFITEPHPAGIPQDFKPDRDRGGDPENDWTLPHFQIGEQAYNFEQAPIIWAKYNDEELPLAYYLKDLIDQINWLTSVSVDTERDISKFIYVLKNYGGQDLGEFISDLKQYLAIKVSMDGGVDKLQADLDMTATGDLLDRLRHDLFTFGDAVDTKDPDLGNASGAAIAFRYMALDNDCAGIANGINGAFDRLKLFIDVYFQATGQGDFTAYEFDIEFNMDMPVNETEVIGNVIQSSGILSEETALANHPWVDDVQAEMKRLKKQRAETLSGFGDLKPPASHDHDDEDDDG